MADDVLLDLDDIKGPEGLGASLDLSDDSKPDEIDKDLASDDTTDDLEKRLGLDKKKDDQEEDLGEQLLKQAYADGKAVPIGRLHKETERRQAAQSELKEVKENQAAHSKVQSPFEAWLAKHPDEDEDVPKRVEMQEQAYRRKQDKLDSRAREVNRDIKDNTGVEDRQAYLDQDNALTILWTEAQNSGLTEAQARQISQAVNSAPDDATALKVAQARCYKVILQQGDTEQKQVAALYMKRILKSSATTTTTTKPKPKTAVAADDETVDIADELQSNQGSVFEQSIF